MTAVFAMAAGVIFNFETKYPTLGAGLAQSM